MLKGILLSIILLVCAGAGRGLANARKRRYELISELLAAMRVLRLRMLNSMEPLGILLRKSDCSLFQQLGNNLWEGGGLTECWQEYRKRESRRCGALAVLGKEDMEILDTFFLNLGSSGRQEQNEMFAAVIVRMEEAQQQAKHFYADASRVYTALGTLIGIGICVLIV